MSAEPWITPDPQWEDREVAKKRELYFKNYKTGEIGQRVPVTGYSERQVERCLRGMLINKHDDWLVIDTADDALPPSDREAP